MINPNNEYIFIKSIQSSTYDDMDKFTNLWNTLLDSITLFCTKDYKYNFNNIDIMLSLFYIERNKNYTPKVKEKTIKINVPGNYKLYKLSMVSVKPILKKCNDKAIKGKTYSSGYIIRHKRGIGIFSRVFYVLEPYDKFYKYMEVSLDYI